MLDRNTKVITVTNLIKMIIEEARRSPKLKFVSNGVEFVNPLMVLDGPRPKIYELHEILAKETKCVVRDGDIYSVENTGGSLYLMFTESECLVGIQLEKL